MAKILSEHQVFVSCWVFSPAWFLPLGLFLLLGHSFLLICCVIQPRFLAVFFGYSVSCFWLFFAIPLIALRCFVFAFIPRASYLLVACYARLSGCLIALGSLPVGRAPVINFPACPARKKERESKYPSTLISTSTRPYNAFLGGVLPLGTLRSFLILPS